MNLEPVSASSQFVERSSCRWMASGSTSRLPSRTPAVFSCRPKPANGGYRSSCWLEIELRTVRVPEQVEDLRLTVGERETAPDRGLLASQERCKRLGAQAPV